MEQAIGSVVLGHRDSIRMVVAAFLAGHHVLLDDEPGVGKTTLATAVAKSIGGSFSRIQGTPDLLPTDLTGSMVFDQQNSHWEYHAGSLLGNVVLVDEVNRISPRTQSALLEAMAEKHVSVDGEVRLLPDPYFVIATMNPSGTVGTFPLTSGQVDRFGISIGLGRVDRATEATLIRRAPGPDLVHHVQPVLNAASLGQLRASIGAVHVSDLVLDYLLQICDAMRERGHLSMRASRAMLEMTQAMAFLNGDGFVTPDHVKAMAAPCLLHRLGQEGSGGDGLAAELAAQLDRIPAPVPTR